MLVEPPHQKVNPSWGGTTIRHRKGRARRGLCLWLIFRTLSLEEAQP